MAVFLSGSVIEPVIGKDNFSDNDWATIIRACQMNRVPKTWAVGDNKTMTINGVEYQIDIIGKNHDVYSDGTGTAPLTFQMRECYATKYTMHSTATNTNGWTNCTMRTTHIPAILALMPTEVKSALREVNKLTNSGGTSSTVVTTADKLFLLSEIEVFGVVSQSKAGEGTRYDYYTNGYSAVKKIGTSNSAYWLRSPKNANSVQYCAISVNGVASVLDANGTSGVSLAFCF